MKMSKLPALSIWPAEKVTHIVLLARTGGRRHGTDGKNFYVTCEAGGEIYVIDAATTK